MTDEEAEGDASAGESPRAPGGQGEGAASAAGAAPPQQDDALQAQAAPVPPLVPEDDEGDDMDPSLSGCGELSNAVAGSAAGVRSSQDRCCVNELQGAALR